MAAFVRARHIPRRQQGRRGTLSCEAVAAAHDEIPFLVLYKKCSMVDSFSLTGVREGVM